MGELCLHCFKLSNVFDLVDLSVKPAESVLM